MSYKTADEFKHLAEQGMFQNSVTNNPNHALIDEMWNHKKRTMLGTCAMCETCGGTSTSWCTCARQRYNPTLSEIEEYQKRKASRN